MAVSNTDARRERTNGAHYGSHQRCTTSKRGVTDLDNALGGSYYHPQHGSGLRVSDQQLFTYMIIMLTAFYCFYLLPHPTSPSRDYVAAPLSLHGLPVGFTERSHQRISGGWRSHGGAEARRKQREESTTGHKGN
jgi:hypothetical protein